MPAESVSPQTVALATRNANVAACSWRLYDAECAAHAAHQSHVEQWITAADAKLHDAVADYESALDANAGSGRRD